MKGFVETVRRLLCYARFAVFIVGMMALCIFSIQSIAYLRGGFEPGGEITIPVTNAVTGTAAYSWVTLLVMWLSLEAVNAVFVVRNWWVHRDRVVADLKKGLSRLTGGVGWL